MPASVPTRFSPWDDAWMVAAYSFTAPVSDET
jgi:hypothetical protein